jgi:hypothetical protein
LQFIHKLPTCLPIRNKKNFLPKWIV